MKRFFLILLISSFCLSLFAQNDEAVYDTRDALTAYKPTYCITGFSEEEQVKVQLSVMYDIFFPIKTGLYLGYTQIMFWDLYSLSGPFKQINYNPEVFWRFESGNNFLGDISILFIDYLQLGYEHLSNGVEGPDSRGWDRVYGEIQMSAGELLNIGFSYKYFWMLLDPENADIQDYIGSMTTNLFIKTRDPETRLDLEEIYFKFGFGGGINGLDFANGWHELGIKTRTLLSRFRFFVYIYHGYAESILEYNVTKITDDNPSGIVYKLGFIIE